jgi:hypothetical protein
MLDHANLLVVSGLSPVETDPWQAWLEWRFPQATWVRPLDGDWPDLDRWSARIDTALAGGGARERGLPWLALGHGFGALALVRHASHGLRAPDAAILVAPADPVRFGQDAASLGHPLPYPSSLLALQRGPHEASPWLRDALAREWAGHWRSGLVDAGAGPTLPPSSWAEGEALVAAHLQALHPPARAYASAHPFVGSARRVP